MVEKSYFCLWSYSSVVFFLEIEGEECLVIVGEVEWIYLCNLKIDEVVREI